RRLSLISRQDDVSQRRHYRIYLPSPSQPDRKLEFAPALVQHARGAAAFGLSGNPVIAPVLDFLHKHREVVGYLAGTLGTLAFLPHVLKTLRMRRTKDISLGMYALLCSGVALWLLYGVLIHSRPVIISNTVTLILAGAVLVLKLRHG